MSWGAVISAGGSLLGGLMQNASSAKAARDQTAFQQEMSNTAHQREVRDLRRAGLNPILSAGAGASAPPGAMPMIKDVLGETVNTALDAVRVKKEISQVDSQRELNTQMGKTQETQQLLNQVSAVREANAGKKLDLENQINEAKLPAVKAQSELNKKQAEIDTKLLKYDNIINRVDQAIGIGNSAMDLVRPKGTLRIEKGEKQKELRKLEKAGVKGVKTFDAESTGGW